jgi:hypothetical protein
VAQQTGLPDEQRPTWRSSTGAAKAMAARERMAVMVNCMLKILREEEEGGIGLKWWIGCGVVDVSWWYWMMFSSRRLAALFIHFLSLLPLVVSKDQSKDTTLDRIAIVIREHHRKSKIVIDVQGHMEKHGHNGST